MGRRCLTILELSEVEKMYREDEVEKRPAYFMTFNLKKFHEERETTQQNKGKYSYPVTLKKKTLSTPVVSGEDKVEIFSKMVEEMLLIENNFSI